MLCPAALALRAASTTQAELWGGGPLQTPSMGLKNEEGPMLKRQGERSYLLGQGGLTGCQWTHTALILCSWSRNTDLGHVREL